MSGTITNTLYRKTIFIDVNSQFSQDANPLQLYDLQAVENMMTNLFLSDPGEVAFEPLLGSGFLAMLFSNPTMTTAWEMIDTAYYAVKRWMPYVNLSLNDSSVYYDPSEGAFYINIAYTVNYIPGLNILSLTLSPKQ